MGIAVAQFFQAYQPAIDQFGNGVWLYTINETAGGENYSYRDFIEWHVRIEKEAQARGLNICHLNHGVGTPEFQEPCRATKASSCQSSGNCPPRAKTRPSGAEWD